MRMYPVSSGINGAEGTPAADGAVGTTGSDSA